MLKRLIKKRSNLFLVLLLIASTAAQARPVSYPGGWTVMSMNDVDKNSVHIHYTLNPRNSIGVRHEYRRDGKYHADFIQHNMLLKRWNARNSQGNIYIKSGAGVAYDDEQTEGAAFTGIAADWEDRRYFIAYENRFLTAGDLERTVKHEARLGITPYIGDAGDLHTWLMIKGEYTPGAQDDFSMTPLVRFFKGSHLLEAGYNLDNGVLLNYIKRF